MFLACSRDSSLGASGGGAGGLGACIASKAGGFVSGSRPPGRWAVQLLQQR